MINKFTPLSPDPFLNNDPDMSLAKFGHINAIVDFLVMLLFHLDAPTPPPE
jgi:hypothetical protein